MPRPRSLAPALLAGHAVLLVLVVVVSLVLLGTGAGPADRGYELGRRLAVLAVGVLVVALVARRVGPRAQSRAGRWSAVAGLVTVGAWLWGTAWLAPFDAATAPLLLVLPLYAWPITLGVLAVAVLVATLDLAAGALLTRRG
ncbi:hypothetical protein [Klenkia taihuensis]|uniref:Uncharacterized protein n=1 Tax=Klenkia taihuensis TaxID=1225127 RepID=A0A1I1MZV8_9ACTN|nr:hypothetical protein [Klenkia taihuensis]GHE12335.1 hypothetical protein GCM10011381_29770 [Klenkia taihuensis]SFC90909.1 hypothetical protein SAMN05661030_1912 [Klenkia taihuensis]